MTEVLGVGRAAELLRAGELVAIPTETVYGLGADASNPHAVAKIFAAKGRPADHPLIVHLPSADHIDKWAIDIPESARQLAAAFWPGPLTLILKRHALVPKAVTGGQNTVGLRVPNHPLTLSLLREFRGGIAAPSANRFGRISPTTAAHVRDELGSELPVLDGGPCQVGIESTILDLSRAKPEILRPGQIQAEDIERIIGVRPAMRLSVLANQSDAPRVSGSLDAHYAPRTPLRLIARDAMAAELAAHGDQRIAVLARSHCATPNNAVHWVTAPADLAGFAHELYAQLRRLDAAGCDLILVESPPDDMAWAGISDRLRRAAVGSGSSFSANGR